MKIKNLTEAIERKKLTEAEDINSLDGSTEEAAKDVVAGAAEVGAGIAPKDAKTIAGDAKQTAEDFKLYPYAATAKLSDVEQILQRCTEIAVSNIDFGVNSDGAYPNVILYGLPGFGKTAVVKRFCKEHGIFPLSIDAKTIRKEQIAGLPKAVKDADGNEYQAGVPTKSILDLKKHKYVILILDELNRAPTDITGTLLGLINDHELPVASYDKDGVWREYTKLDNILFTIAMINPASKDLFTNVHELDPAMMGRLVFRHEMNGNKAEFLEVLNKVYGAITGLELLPPEYKNRYQGQWDIAKALLTSKNFRWDDRNLAVKAHKAQRTGAPTGALAYRNLLTLLRSCDGTKADFLKVLSWSSLLPETQLMLENCLATYTDKISKANNLFTQQSPAAQKYGKQVASDAAKALSDFDKALEEFD
jgi:hypothetical protein